MLAQLNLLIQMQISSKNCESSQYFQFVLFSFYLHLRFLFSNCKIKLINYIECYLNSLLDRKSVYFCLLFFISKHTNTSMSYLCCNCCCVFANPQLFRICAEFFVLFLFIENQVIMFVYFVLYHVPSCIPFTKKRFSQILTHSHIIDIDTRYQHCILLIYVRTCIVGFLGLCFFCNFASDRNFGLSFIDFGKSCVWSIFIWFFFKKKTIDVFQFMVKSR